MTLAVFIPKNRRALLCLTCLLGAIPLVVENDYFLLLFNIMALNALVVLGLNLLIASTGQVSLGHAAFYGMGAYLSAIAATAWHLPPLYSVCLSTLLTGLVAFLLALPTLRLEGHYLVMATLGFNIVVTILLNQLEGITGGPSGLPGIPRLNLGFTVLDSDFSFYWFMWALFLVVFALTLNLTDSRLGRALRAIREKEVIASTLGIHTNRYKTIVFVLSAVYAALAGFCYAHYVTFISPKTFDIFYSVQIVTMVVVGGMGNLWGGLVGTALITSLPELLHRFEDYYVLVYGLILMSVLVFCPQGLLPALASLCSFRRARTEDGMEPPGESGVECQGHPPERVPPPAPGFGSNSRRSVGTVTNVRLDSIRVHSSPSTRDPDPGHSPPLPRFPVLSIEDLSLAFGGLQALNNIGFDVCPGEIVALIGPNGAGKTTVLNVISGLLRPDSGDIRLSSESLLRLAPHEIAARGVGRTFQAVQIYQKLTVIENTLLGCHLRGRSGFVRSCLHCPIERKEEATLHAVAHQILSSIHVGAKAHLPAQRLTLVEQKLLELARALALSPSLLLLDEPVGGLDPRESEVLVHYISLLREQGVGTILVEHDMDVVMRLADRVVVLQHGSLIASGTPEQIRRDPRVVSAYLGASAK